MLYLWYLHIQVTNVWWWETVGRERTSLMLSQLVSSPICNVIFVIFTLTSDPRLMMRDCRQTSGKDVFIVVTTCVQSHLSYLWPTFKWPTFDEERLQAGKEPLYCCYNLCSVSFVIFVTHLQVTHVWWGETLGRERTSLMLLQLVSSPICYVIFVIFTHTSDPRLIRGACRQWQDVFNVVTTCVQSHLLCYFCDIYTYKWPTFDEERM